MAAYNYVQTQSPQPLSSQQLSEIFVVESTKLLKNGTKMFRINEGMANQRSDKIFGCRDFALGLITIASVYVLIMIL